VVRNTPMSPAAKRYMARFMPLMALYVVVLMGALFAMKGLDAKGPLLWALAVAPALPLIGAIGVMGLYLLEEKDEFPRAVLVESMIWGIGILLVATTVWGFLENADLVPHVPSFLMFPFFCGAMGLSQIFVWRRYR
jgi:hypothetical protein